MGFEMGVFASGKSLAMWTEVRTGFGFLRPGDSGSPGGSYREEVVWG
eukprot:CAMPEP_0174338786 /NCGR_PEP_ID=MMETSP0810-20121108/23427_1 /TAXON_ID=73025 ORGANISM="Eutreptiella gymnastica-like, Strain CCMP1594" /NCGR_SAMPLE_ID=MMETSP0810 /ASSEMBLY_ACC=CAM_ASM_000659 /LENGTH=46 /DNA_ID= /DNA_START= /DNA_END= /DNA_ORIENTATION=